MKKIIFTTSIISSLLMTIICYTYYQKKLRVEFERGLMTGADYYNKHGQFPSYWHWNKKYENPRFNIDTVLRPYYGIDSLVINGNLVFVWDTLNLIRYNLDSPIKFIKK